MRQQDSNQYIVLVYGLISLVAYLLFAYTFDRSDFGGLLTTYLALFGLYLLILKHINRIKNPLHWGIGFAVAFRISLLFAIPTLSDDFYRFIWDGNLMINGINPFLQTPEALMEDSSLPFSAEFLYKQMNSGEYYSVYPALSQYVFGFAALISGSHLPGNLLVLRGVMLVAEIGSLWCLYHLLGKYGLDRIYLLIYALNPLIIVELTGNLHFEAVMIFFLLLALLLFLNNRSLWASLALTAAINIKLIPLLLVPYLFFSLGWHKAFRLALVMVTGTIVFHLPFLEASFIQHFSTSLGLYFQTFEFNASLYYLVRWVGYLLKGYNIIQTAGPLLAATSALFILTFSWRYRDSSLQSLPFVYIITIALFYFFSTTVHPWYVASLIAFVPLSGMFFPLAWSALIPVSYLAYASFPYTENMGLIACEYVIVLAFLYWDWKNRNLTSSQKLRVLN